MGHGAWVAGLKLRGGGGREVGLGSIVARARALAPEKRHTKVGIDHEHGRDGIQLMQGLIIDYAGVLDLDAEDQRRWTALIEAVKASGTGVAILSNEEAEGETAEKIREWEFRGVVDAVVLSGEIGWEKPERAAFQGAANALDVSLNDCVMVDDDIMNVRAAVEHGMIGILHTAFERTSVEIQSLFDIPGEF
ncbi:HAD-IA family hydrolase [Corynebacterium sp. LK2510]